MTINKEKHFINLTNGIEVLNSTCPPDISEISFIRILSSRCEARKWDTLLMDLDNNFLMYLALGYTCIIYDYSSHKKVPRACYQGMEWIKYALNRNWFKQNNDAYIHKHNCREYFDRCYNNLLSPTRRKLRYFKKFLNTSKLNLLWLCNPTKNDGNYDYYKKILLEKIQ